MSNDPVLVPLTREGRVEITDGHYDGGGMFVSLDPRTPGHLPPLVITLQVRPDASGADVADVVERLRSLVTGMTITSLHLTPPTSTSQH